MTQAGTEVLFCPGGGSRICLLTGPVTRPFSGPYQYRFLNAHLFFNSTLLPWAQYNRLGGFVTLKPFKGLTITTGVADPGSSAVDVNWFEDGDWDLLREWRLMAHPFGEDTIR